MDVRLTWTPSCHRSFRWYRPTSPDGAREIADILAGLQSRPQVIAGAGGTGKSTLAAYVAHGAAESYPDGQLYAELRGMTEAPAAPAEVLGRFLRALGTPVSELPDSTAERAELYRTMVAARRILIVLDDAHNEQQVRPLLPGSATCAVVITSRSRLSGLPGTSLTELDVLSPKEAIALLSQFLGEDRVLGDIGSAQKIVSCCGRQPLALRIAAARLTSRRNLPLRWLADRLADESRRLQELTAGDLGVRASIQLSYDSLDARERLTLRRLRFLGVQEFGPDVAGRLARLSDAEAEETVELLVDAQLVGSAGIDSLGTPRYRIHDLVRLFAREQAELQEPHDDLLACVARAIDGWLALTRTTAALMSRDHPWQHAFADIPGGARTTPTDLTARFDAEQPALVIGIERAVALGMHKFVARFAAGELWPVFIRSGRFELRHRIIEAVLSSVRLAGDVRGEATMLANLGQLRYMRDQMAGARLYLAEAMNKFRETGDILHQIGTLAGLGTACRESGRLVESIHFLNEALTLLDASGDDTCRGYVLRLLGSVRLERGEFNLALSNLESSLDAYLRAGNRRGEGLALRTLGLYYRAIGELDVALVHCAKSREIFRELGDEWLEAYAVRAEAKAMVRLGRSDEALKPLEWALSVCQRTADKWGQGATLLVLGELHLAAGRHDLAETFLDAAMSVWRVMEAPLWTARTQRVLSALYAVRGETQRAEQALRTAVTTFRDHGAREYAELQACRKRP